MAFYNNFRFNFNIQIFDFVSNCSDSNLNKTIFISNWVCEIIFVFWIYDIKNPILSRQEADRFLKVFNIKPKWLRWMLFMCRFPLQSTNAFHFWASYWTQFILIFYPVTPFVMHEVYQEHSDIVIRFVFPLSCFIPPLDY